MVKENYIKSLKEIVRNFDPKFENRYFVFGSATRKEKFFDIDLGVKGNSDAKKDLSRLRELFEESTFPYFVDVVDFDSASEKFTNYVYDNEKILWIN